MVGDTSMKPARSAPGRDEVVHGGHLGAGDRQGLCDQRTSTRVPFGLLPDRRLPGLGRPQQGRPGPGGGRAERPQDLGGRLPHPRAVVLLQPPADALDHGGRRPGELR